jgi:hypothetical protein
LRAIRRGATKVITGGGVVERYDLASDPNETNDLAVATPPVSLLARLEEWTEDDEVEAKLATLDELRDPTRRHVLRTLGYSASRSISGARPHPREALPEWLRAQDAKDTLRAAAGAIAQQRYEEAIRLATECLAVLPRNAEVAERLDELPDEQRLQLTGVNVEYQPADETAWSISAARGSSPRDGSLLDLVGNVQMRSVPADGSKPRTISTESLRFWPDTSKVETEAPVSFRVGDWQVDGVGLRADLKEDTLELESSHGIFAPH